MHLPKSSDALPSFFMNSVPKSGTNLLLQILSGMPGVTHDPTHAFFDPQDFVGSFYKLGQMSHNQFGVGHISYSPEWSYLLQRLQMKHIFIIRDLRDVVVSLSHFVVEKPMYHQLDELHRYLTSVAKSRKERLLALIKGVHAAQYSYPSLREWFEPFRGWLTDHNTLAIRYEDLVSSSDMRHVTLTEIAQYLWKDLNPPIPISNMVEQMEQNINPSTCGTFRTGQIGSWKMEFDSEVKAAFQEVAGSLLIDLGYEIDLNW